MLEIRAVLDGMLGFTGGVSKRRSVFWEFNWPLVNRNEPGEGFVK